MNSSKTRVLILGGDGYLGWPTAMYLAQRGYHVTVADNYYRRAIAKKTDSAPLWPTSKLPQRCEEFQRITGRVIRYFEADLASETNMFRIFEETQPDTVIHYAEQPSAPYSMAGFEEARQTIELLKKIESCYPDIFKSEKERELIELRYLALRDYYYRELENKHIRTAQEQYVKILQALYCRNLQVARLYQRRINITCDILMSLEKRRELCELIDREIVKLKTITNPSKVSKKNTASKAAEESWNKTI